MEMKLKMIDKMTILWIVFMFISATLGLTCDSLFGIDVIYYVIGMIILWFVCLIVTLMFWKRRK